MTQRCLKWFSTYARLAIVTAMLGVSVSATAVETLTPHIAEYKIKVKVLSGRLNTEVRLTEHGYSAHSVLTAAGFASNSQLSTPTARSVRF